MQPQITPLDFNILKMGNSLADSYKRVKEIGKGSYGVVYLAERKEDSQLVAIKTVSHTGQRRLSYRALNRRSLKRP